MVLLLIVRKQMDSNTVLLSSKLWEWEYLNVLQYKDNLKTKWEVDAIVTALLLLIIALIMRIMIIIQIK